MPSRPAARKITNSGSTTAAIGAMRVEMIQNETVVLAAELAARQPVAGQEPRTTAISVEMPAARIELTA